jgi:Raf kinase inhibitor-like YbhB/YbcL family protein
MRGSFLCYAAKYSFRIYSGKAEFMMALRVESPVFESNNLIPAKYTCDGEDVNPPLTVENVPDDAKSLVLILDDPDAVGVWNHWLVWNIPAGTREIEEHSVPGVQGANTGGRRRYGGPCPPSGTHRYFFKVYALDIELDLDVGSKKKDVENAMRGHVLAEGELMGLYRRS